MIVSRAFREFTPPAMTCEIAAAVLGAGALGAGASIYGAQTAAAAQTNAAQMAIQNQQSMYANNSNILSPFINAGAGAIPQLQNWLNPSGGSTGSNPLSQLINFASPSSSSSPLSTLMSLVTPGPNQNATLSQTPGYQFAQDQGTRQITSALAGRGLGGSPGAITADVGQYSSGLASQNYNNIVQHLLQTYGAGTGALQNIFSSGAGALQGLVSTGTSAGGALAGVGTNTANSITGSITGAGNAQAAAANATGGAVAGLGNSAVTSALLAQLTGGGGSGSIYGSLFQNTGPTGTNYGTTSTGGAPLAGYEGLTPNTSGTAIY